MKFTSKPIIALRILMRANFKYTFWWCFKICVCEFCDACFHTGFKREKKIVRMKNRLHAARICQGEREWYIFKKCKTKTAPIRCLWKSNYPTIQFKFCAWEMCEYFWADDRRTKKKQSEQYVHSHTHTRTLAHTQANEFLSFGNPFSRARMSSVKHTAYDKNGQRQHTDIRLHCYSTHMWYEYAMTQTYTHTQKK